MTCYGRLGLLVCLATTGSLAMSQAPTPERIDTGRFVIEGDTVADRRSSLVWQRCSVGQRWQADLGCVGLAQKLWFQEAKQLENATWRLPAVDELKTLFDARLESLIDSIAFPDAPATWYWAVGPRQQAVALGVSCGSGGNDSCYQNDARAVRLVRRAPAVWPPK
jgi:hypothetical protein